MEKQRLIDQFHKNSTELVEVNLSEWKSQSYVDVRIWHLPDPVKSGIAQPTKKGICINTELLPRLINALQKVQKSLEKTSENAQDKRSQVEQGNN